MFYRWLFARAWWVSAEKVVVSQGGGEVVSKILFSLAVVREE